MGNEITYRGPAPVSENGVLACWVQQPVDNTPATNSSGQMIYTEKWKGPYSQGINILDDVKAGDIIDTFHGWLGENRISYFDIPSIPTDDPTVDLHWTITSLRVSELQAGDHCTITVEFSHNMQKLQDSDTWEVSWQAYTVTPYEFCSGKVHKDITVSPSFTVGSSEMDWTLPASRQMIEQYRSHNPQIVKGNDGTADEGEEDVTLYVY